MTQEELLATTDKTFKKCLSIMKSKNHDYSQDGDAFTNFRLSKLVGVGVEDGILIRMSDKIARIANCIHKGEVAVKGESVTDSCEDLINYSAILLAYLTSTLVESPEAQTR